MKRYVIVALALVVSASFLTAGAAKKDKKKKVEAVVEAPAPVSLVSASDSLSYAAGMSMTNGLMPFLKQQLNFNEAYMDDFIEDIQEVMASMRHRYFPVLDKNDHYIGMISRRNFLGAHKKQLILVDHNEKNQAVNGADAADIKEIVDHHRLRTIETAGPVYFRNMPLGSTCTIIYLMYKEYAQEIDPTTAGLLLAAILSDTLMFRSPTCTKVDRDAGEELARIAGIDYEEFAKEMFHAGSNLGSKTADEIIHQDFKKFTVDDMTIGIGQINSMSAEELIEIKDKIMPELKEVAESDGLDMLFFMLTNIIDESSQVVFSGAKALHTLNSAFGINSEGDVVSLPGVVSRKKQLLPAIVETIQQ